MIAVENAFGKPDLKAYHRPPAADHEIPVESAETGLIAPRLLREWNRLNFEKWGNLDLEA